MIEQIILVRHGETEHNLAGIAQGWTDSALSPLGRKQVTGLAARVSALRPDALFSSPLGRARASAEIIAQATRLEIRFLDDLREMSYGGWEGKSFLDVRRDDHEIYQRWIADADVASPGGESHNDVLRRMQSAIKSIREGDGAEYLRPIVVSHGTAIRIAATVLLEAPIEVSRSLAQDNASFNLFIRRGERLILKVWNDTTHCR
ncbi:MAG: histidine phosphatase family protein [Acidobacteriota bacterium]